MGFRSPTCASRSTGKPLMAYQSEVEAQGRARLSTVSLGRDMSSYRCTACQLWHLKPSRPAREQWSKCSYCVGRDGKSKASYPTQQEAERQAERSRERSYVRLRAYGCAHSAAWHLTSKC